MTESKSAGRGARRAAAGNDPAHTPSSGFTAEEQAAMRERARELQASRRGKADGESEVLAKIAEMPPADRILAERIHALIRTSAPSLTPKTWYGMPAYAQAGDVICFFQGAHKFKARYATLGFGDKARLDDGAMWPTSFALIEWTGVTEAAVRALVERAVRLD